MYCSENSQVYLFIFMSQPMHKTVLVLGALCTYIHMYHIMVALQIHRGKPNNISDFNQTSFIIVCSFSTVVCVESTPEPEEPDSLPPQCPALSQDPH